MRLSSLAWRLCLREWRAGELRVLATGLLVAVATVTAIGLFTDRLNRAMLYRAADLLGADLVVASSREMPREWISRARELGLRTARTLEFGSMVRVGDRLQLAGVKAVTADYPLRGELSVGDRLYTVGEGASRPPEAGESWAEARLFTLLEAEPGATVRVGRLDLPLRRVLAFEPDRGGDFYSLAPRLMMRMEDVPATEILQPGSRVTWRYLFAGDESAVRAMQDWLRPRLQDRDTLMDVKEGNPAARYALQNTERYLHLASLVAVLLAGVAIAVSARRYAQRHFDTVALLRCQGASHREVLGLFSLQLALLGLVFSLLGVLLGWLGHLAVLTAVRDMLPSVVPAAHPATILLGFLAGVVILPAFALPALFSLGQVPVYRVIRRDALPQAAGSLSSVLLAALGIFGLGWWFTGDAELVLIAGGGAVLLSLVLGLGALLLMRIARGARHLAPGAVRQGLQGLFRRPAESIGQVLAFSLVFMVLGLVASLRADLLETWTRQLPADAPNQFAVNIFPHELQPVREYLRAQGVETSGFYPIVRGRLMERNGQSIKQTVSKEESERRVLNRDLSLTWATDLPPDNRIVDGAWWSADAPRRQEVSVESLLAKRLGIRVGDQLTFQIGSAALDVTVGSIRELDWDTFRPNFYMIFPPHALAELPATYITSFYLERTRKETLNGLIRNFPSISLLDMEQIMGQARRLLDQLALAVEAILVFVLIAGIVVLAASISASMDVRMREGALMRALGAGRQRIRAQQLAEFSLLGVLSGILAAIGAEVALWQLYGRLFELPYAPNWLIWVGLPLTAAVLLGGFGWLATRRVVLAPPLTVLREGA